MTSFKVEEAFHIVGRGWIVAGEVTEGEISRDDDLEANDRIYTVTGIEQFVVRSGMPATPGYKCGLLLRGIESKDEMPPGTILKTPLDALWSL